MECWSFEKETTVKSLPRRIEKIIEPQAVVEGAGGLREASERKLWTTSIHFCYWTTSLPRIDAITKPDFPCIPIAVLKP